MHRLAASVLVLVVVPAAASSAAAARLADDAASLAVAACRGADATPAKAARAWPELWVGVGALLAGPPPRGGGRVDAGGVLAAAQAALRGAVARDDDTVLESAPAAGGAPSSLRGALARRPASPAAPRPGTPPTAEAPPRRRLADAAAGLVWALPAGGLEPVAAVVGSAAAGPAAAEPAPLPAADDVESLAAMMSGGAPAWAAFEGGAPQPPPSADPFAAVPLALLTPAPATAAADGWVTFGQAAAVAAAAAPPPAARRATAGEAAAVADGSAIRLAETWRGEFVGDALVKAGTHGEVRAAGAAARAAGAALAARVELRPPSGDGPAAVAAACLATARADPGLVARAKGGALVAALGAASARALLLYRLPAVAAPVPLVARLRVVPAPGGAAGCALVVEWEAGRGRTLPRGLVSLTVPPAVGPLTRCAPRGAWVERDRALAWRVPAGAVGAVRAAFAPARGAPPDALAACGVPGGGPAAAARGAVATLVFEGVAGAASGVVAACGPAGAAALAPAPAATTLTATARPDPA